jgi:hypothetical protein
VSGGLVRVFGGGGREGGVWRGGNQLRFPSMPLGPKQFTCDDD